MKFFSSADKTTRAAPPKNPQRRNIEYWHGFVRCGNVAVALAVRHAVLRQIFEDTAAEMLRFIRTPSAMPSLAFRKTLRCCGKFTEISQQVQVLIIAIIGRILNLK